ncbi:MAG: hypothetical protein K8R63_01930 [Bacteroidales bacterium]|nr:hypothetical protein [Bacteroidales bacterium]
MSTKQTYNLEEPFLQQEIILGMLVAIGMLLMVASEDVGMLMVSVGLVLLEIIFLYRIYKIIKGREEVVKHAFIWLNNLAMILAAAGILMLMLMDAFHRPVFFTGLGILVLVLLLNGFFLRYNMKGMTHITVQLRLVIALVILIVFFLL